MFRLIRCVGIWKIDNVLRNGLAARISVKALEYYGCSDKNQDERPKDFGEHGDELIRQEDESDYYYE